MEKSTQGMGSTLAKSGGKLSQIFKRSRQSYCELPKTDKKAKELKKEIERQHPEHSKHSLTVSYYERHSLLANAIMPHLYSQSLEKERADFFVKLLKPSFNTKMEDFFHFSSYPLNLRTGVSRPDIPWPTFVPKIFPPPGRKIRSSLKSFQICRLAKKKEEKGKDSRYAKSLQDFHLQRALIEAQDGKEQEARKFLTKALEMNSSSALDPNSQKLVKETERALGKLKK